MTYLEAVLIIKQKTFILIKLYFEYKKYNPRITPKEPDISYSIISLN